MADAKWSAVLKSRSLTVEFTSAKLLCNNVVTIPLISDLKTGKTDVNHSDEHSTNGLSSMLT